MRKFKFLQLPLTWFATLIILLLVSACTNKPLHTLESKADPKKLSLSPPNPTARPLQLVAGLADSQFKTQLSNCANGPFYRTGFSIAHRGAPKGYPEHTREGYIAAANMGAGIMECDVTFTKDLALVCRHSQCDLHRTTNILKTPLAAQCRQPFIGATPDTPAQAECCTSDITLAEFRSLCGRRDEVQEDATNVDDYLTIEPTQWQRDAPRCGTLLTHAESIKLFETLGTGHIPELKAAQVDMPFAGLDQRSYAGRMLQAYIDAGINPANVWPQSFNVDDVLYWIRNYPAFGSQAVYLDGRGRDPDFKPTLDNMLTLKAQGINIVAPPMPALLTLDANGQLQASAYAKLAKQAGLEIITWTFESGDADNPDNWLYANLGSFMHNESQSLAVLHALQQQVGILGIFSDWAGTVTYYANCLDLP